jgi:hypothetical protein
MNVHSAVPCTGVLDWIKRGEEKRDMYSGVPVGALDLPPRKRAPCTAALMLPSMMPEPSPLNLLLMGHLVTARKKVSSLSLSVVRSGLSPGPSQREQHSSERMSAQLGYQHRNWCIEDFRGPLNTCVIIKELIFLFTCTCV